ncbi:uncharacterized protein LOC111638386 [Centruroides sculpturatus]|uniref:uncharacterized protein LOC111638386 n=1 Tax=Centruroides sculpturatus TaxID=218467 RepID=UPI000C6CB8FA|nr:uncharacterized protein LOC111638386 [Centruroides sculpturatus]
MGERLNSEVQHRIQCGGLNWRNLSGVLCDKKFSCKLKGKLYKSVVRPGMLYGAETWAITRTQERKMEVAEIRMLRWMCGVSRKDRIRNEFIRGSVKVGPLSRKMQEDTLRWFGHVEQSSEDYAGKKVGKLVAKGMRKRGRPRLHWKDRWRKTWIRGD